MDEETRRWLEDRVKVLAMRQVKSLINSGGEQGTFEWLAGKVGSLDRACGLLGLRSVAEILAG